MLWQEYEMIADDTTQHAHAVVAANFLATLGDNECRAWIGAILALRSLSRLQSARVAEQVPLSAEHP